MQAADSHSERRTMVRSARKQMRLLLLLAAVCALAVLSSPNSATVDQASLAVEQWSLAWQHIANAELSVGDRAAALASHAGQGAAATGSAAVGLVGDVARLVGRAPALLT